MIENIRYSRDPVNKTVFTKHMYQCAICLLNIGFGKRAISKLTGMHAVSILRIRKRLNIKASDRKTCGLLVEKKKKPTKSKQLGLGIEFDDVSKRINSAHYVSGRYKRKMHTHSIFKKLIGLSLENERLVSVIRRRKDNEWLQKNKDKVRQYRKRRSKLPHVKLENNLRRRLKEILKEGLKGTATRRLIGCTGSELKAHLESKFTGAMCWDNYGSVWHVDHIRPCASFDLSDPLQQLECFNFTNLQPLLAEDNIKKSSNWLGVRYLRGITPAPPKESLRLYR